jgi:cbb3-type cytochrome oxidase subunit 3
MQDFEKIILSKMKDIEGLHEVSAWPLGVGWWIIFSVILLLIIFFSYRHFKKARYRRSWMYSLELHLEKLQQELNSENVKEIASEVNETLKRLAIQSYGREEVASKEGETWLKWLTNNDPKGFNWQKKGQIIIKYPYMPKEMAKGKKRELSNIIKAVKGWVNI